MEKIFGYVFNIVDDDTFDMIISHAAPENKKKYNSKVRIRISSLDIYGMPDKKKKRDRAELEQILLNKEVGVAIDKIKEDCLTGYVKVL